MKIKLHQAGYISSKIAIDLANISYVSLLKEMSYIIEVIRNIIDENFNEEINLDLKVNEILEEYTDEIESNNVRERELFFMIKKRLAKEDNIIIDFNEKYNDLSHSILTELYENYLIDYSVNENKVKNIILNSFISFAKIYDELDDKVSKKIRSMKKDYIVGSPEFDLLHQRLYEEELQRLGFIN